MNLYYHESSQPDALARATGQVEGSWASSKAARTRRPRRDISRIIRGFTLIELLVVIASITILSSLILPALAGAQAKGKRLACGSNMRQLAFGLLAFADDSNQAIPMATDYSVPLESLERIWVTSLADYLDSEQVFLCPSATRSRFENAWPGRGWLSIGYNGNTAYDPKGLEAPASKPRLSQLADPSRTVLMADTPSGPTEEKYRGYVFSPKNGIQNGMDPRLSTPKLADLDLVLGSASKPSQLKPVFARHQATGNNSGLANLLFGDGHVQAYSASLILLQEDGANLIWSFR